MAEDKVADFTSTVEQWEKDIMKPNPFQASAISKNLKNILRCCITL